MNISIEQFLTDENENTEFIPIISEEDALEQLESQSGDECLITGLTATFGSSRYGFVSNSNNAHHCRTKKIVAFGSRCL